MKILFSIKPDWEADIRSGFESTEHEIAFADFATADLRDHDLIVPLNVPALHALHAQPETVALNPIPIPGPESVALCDDKLSLNRTLRREGYSDCIPMFGPFQAFPYILKKRHDEWGAHSYIMRGPDDEARHADLLGDPEYFCQEYIPGHTEYTTHVLFRNGRLVCSATLEFTFEHEVFIKGREPDCGRAPCNCVHLELFGRILATIGFEGLCCFNYKVQGRQAMIFEINPRFGASLGPLFAKFLVDAELIRSVTVEGDRRFASVA